MSSTTLGSVKEVLAEMKDTAELLIDLSFSAVLHGSDDIAEEVLALEGTMDVLQLQARMSLLMAARSPEDAEVLAPVLGVVGAAEKISDAAGDIAKVVLEDIGLADAMRAALPEAIETLVRGTIAETRRTLAGQTLGDIEHRDRDRGTHHRHPSSGRLDYEPRPRDDARSPRRVLLRGSRRRRSDVYEQAPAERTNRRPTPEAGDRRLRTRRRLHRADEEHERTRRRPGLRARSSSTARTSQRRSSNSKPKSTRSSRGSRRGRSKRRAASTTPSQLRGLIHLASSTEVISDAALEISEGVLRGLGPHPVVAARRRESRRDHRPPHGRATEASSTTRRSPTERVKTETGMRVIAVRRPPDDWVISPGPETEVHAGDVLLAKGTRAGAERLQELSGEERMD